MNSIMKLASVATFAGVVLYGVHLAKSSALLPHDGATGVATDRANTSDSSTPLPVPPAILGDLRARLLAGAAAAAAVLPSMNAKPPSVRDTEPFKDFVMRARLRSDEAQFAAHTIDLYRLNANNLRTTSAGDEELNSMERQLLGDTIAQLRVKLPAGAWDALVASNVLPEAAGFTRPPPARTN
jgi:hypothetical protein